MSRMLFVFGALLALGMNGASNDTRARCPVSIEYAYYDVTGTTAEEIRASLLEKGPRGSAGEPRFATAAWRVKYRWNEGTDWSHGPIPIDIQCTAVVTLPRLRPTHGATQKTFLLWERYIERIKWHELNHLRGVEKRAFEISARINAELSAGRKFSTRKAHEIAADVIAELRRLDRAYDEQTNHGKLEGIWDPLSIASVEEL